MQRDLSFFQIIPFNVHDYSLMIHKFVSKLDQQIRNTGITKLLIANDYNNIINNLMDAVKRFQTAAKIIHTIVEVKIMVLLLHRLIY